LHSPSSGHRRRSATQPEATSGRVTSDSRRVRIGPASVPLRAWCVNPFAQPAPRRTLARPVCARTDRQHRGRTPAPASFNACGVSRARRSGERPRWGYYDGAGKRPRRLVWGQKVPKRSAKSSKRRGSGRCPATPQTPCKSPDPNPMGRLDRTQEIAGSSPASSTRGSHCKSPLSDLLPTRRPPDAGLGAEQQPEAGTTWLERSACTRPVWTRSSVSSRFSIRSARREKSSRADATPYVRRAVPGSPSAAAGAGQGLRGHGRGWNLQALGRP